MSSASCLFKVSSVVQGEFGCSAVQGELCFLLVQGEFGCSAVQGEFFCSAVEGEFCCSAVKGEFCCSRRVLLYNAAMLPCCLNLPGIVSALLPVDDTISDSLLRN